MTREIPIEFQRKLDEFNRSVGGPTEVRVVWEPRSERWEVWAIPLYPSSHPKARFFHRGLLKRLPTEEELWGVHIFTWCVRDENGRDIGYAPLDDRIFTVLRTIDTYKRSLSASELRERLEEEKDEREKKRLRDIIYSLAEYYKRIDSPIISMDPSIRVKGDWRTPTSPYR